MQYFDNIADYLLCLMAHIGNLNDNNERIRLYEYHKEDLQDYSMIFVDNIYGTDKLELLNAFADLNYDMNSLFASNKLLCVNEESLIKNKNWENHYFLYQPCISFDLNIISQLRYLKSSEYDSELKEVVKICESQMCTFDCLNFVIENYMKNPDKKSLDSFVIEDIRNFEETFPYINCYTGEIVPIEKRMENLISYYKGRECREVIAYFYDKYYTLELLYLMAIVYVHFKYEKLTPKNKFEKFLEFCEKEIMLFHTCAINLAKLFYENPNLRFFKKIQKNNKKLLENIKNMAWDLFHLRFMEETVQSARKEKNIIQIPVFISKDKGLNEIRTAYQIKCLFKNNISGECQFFYNMDSITVEQKNKYFNVEAMKKRTSASHDKNSVIRGLEYLLTNIVG